ncbi:MAG: filamentous hemagglutinin N-terminal domain-containing protein, partial [Stellaceae bacterium]
MAAAPAWAQLAGGKVVVGQATISSPVPGRTVIQQTTGKALYTWQNFSIPSGSAVSFVQPGASSIAMNRVIGGSASVIAGSLSSNGQVWLVNRAGITTSAGAHISVAGLILSTADMSDDNFKNGNYLFDRPGDPGAAISNAGHIDATGGSAILAGEHVGNSGVIEARLGSVVLGGAKTYAVDFTGDGLL